MIKICAKHDYTYTEGKCPGCEYDALQKTRNIFDPWQPSIEQVETEPDDETIVLADRCELKPDKIIRSKEEMLAAFGQPYPQSGSFLDSAKFAIEKYFKK